MTRLPIIAVCFPVVFLICSISVGEDWPQFRHDTGRTAATSESLPPNLHPLWSRELPPPRPTFPGEIRLRYDATYEPVIAGNRLFVPSMVTDSLTAYDLETGIEKWVFFAEGPIRFAPAVGDNKVYFVSDDGNLYCVKADDGHLLWKFRGATDDKTNRKILGNRRMVSLFPARGGPMLADGVVYFAAGIWSGEGVFVHALDATSGRPIWSNTDSDRIERANMDHGISYFAGISPQGYLTIVDGRLIVPCGAQLPAVLDLKTGKRGPYTMGWGGRTGLAKGCWFTAGIHHYLLHGGDLYDIRRVNDEKFKRGRSNDFKKMLYLGGFTRLQIDRANQKGLGAFRRPVLTPNAIFYQDKGIVAFDLTQLKVAERASLEALPYRRHDEYPDKLRGLLPELWRLPVEATVHIKAGNRLYCSRPNLIDAVEIPAEGKSPRIGWKADIQGTPHSMLAANGKLVVVTREGRLYAFGEQKRAEPIVHTLTKDLAPKHDPWTLTAANLVKQNDTNTGFILALGIGSGRLAEELARQSRRDVILIDPDAEKVTQFRRKYHQAGLYGTRITILHGQPGTYPLPPYFASLIVSEDPTSLGENRGAVCAELLMHCLRPYGGIALITLDDKARDLFVKTVSKRESAGITVLPPSNPILAMREGGLPDSADWTHSGVNAANTGASQDRFVKPPLARLWFDGSFRWNRVPGASIVRVVEGRIFINSRTLDAIDVFTGRPLWKANLPAANPSDEKMVALKDAIYLASGRTCIVLDPATGEKIRQIELPDEVTGAWSIVRASGDSLFGACGKWLVCLNRHTGKVVWKHQCVNSVGSLAASEKMVFAADYLNRRRGDNPKDVPIHAFDVQTGKKQWQSTGGQEIRYYQPKNLLCTSRGVLQADKGARGARLGTSAVRMIVGDKFLSGDDQQVILIDPQTGEKIGKPLAWNRRGCTRLRGSVNMLTTRFMGNAAYIDIETRQITSIWNVRAACSNNLFVANGVLNIPNLSGGCTCNYQPISQAFVPAAVIER